MVFFWIVFVCAASATGPSSSTRDHTSHLTESDILPLPERGEAGGANGNKSSKWPDGVIPIALHNNFNETEKQKIIDAVNEIVEKTCLTFRYTTDDDQDYVQFWKPNQDECSSHIGRIGGMQRINLHPNCLISRKSILHEIMHALGFLHEHNRFDRDNYITIVYDNIEPNMKYNFRKRFEEASELPKTEYSYDSIMHYPHNHFSIDPKKSTIVSKKAGITKFGGGENLSEIDVIRINRHYGCVTTPPTNPPFTIFTPAPMIPEPSSNQTLWPFVTTGTATTGPATVHLATRSPPTVGQATRSPATTPATSTPAICGLVPKRLNSTSRLPQLKKSIAQWSYNCKSSGKEICNFVGRKEDCGKTCASHPTCEHFVWERGYCSLMSTHNPNTAELFTTKYGSSCGFIGYEKTEAGKKWTVDSSGFWWNNNCNFSNFSQTPGSSVHGHWKDCSSLCNRTYNCYRWVWYGRSSFCFLIPKPAYNDKVFHIYQQQNTVCGIYNRLLSVSTVGQG